MWRSRRKSDGLANTSRSVTGASSSFRSAITVSILRICRRSLSGLDGLDHVPGFLHPRPELRQQPDGKGHEIISQSHQLAGLGKLILEHDFQTQIVQPSDKQIFVDKQVVPSLLDGFTRAAESRVMDVAVSLELEPGLSP